MTPALNGIKIIDIGYYLPAAFCTQMLGDMGADVIKIEEPITDKPRRGGAGVSSAPGEDAEERRAYDFFNRNKKSIILNLKTKEAIDIFYQLAETADVVIENMRPGVVNRLGVRLTGRGGDASDGPLDTREERVDLGVGHHLDLGE